MICFQISIFEPLETARFLQPFCAFLLWFAFKLVSLNHWKQLFLTHIFESYVVICFQISIFEPLETAKRIKRIQGNWLWFAFKLVSLNHWKQLRSSLVLTRVVVICFQISIFEPLETAINSLSVRIYSLWFAFKLVSLNHWKQRLSRNKIRLNCCDLLSN